MMAIDADTPAEPMIDDLLVETRGRVGIITLNRPRSLNALTMPMVQAIDRAITLWRDHPDIDAVVMRGAGGKAYCAGGDVKVVLDEPAGPAAYERGRTFFSLEYRLNYRFHIYPKPVIALMDGITMGGGCGVSLHASHPVATEKILLAMPETVLGLFPDVGASWFYGRLPGAMGVYLGLTGRRLNRDDVLALGLAKTAIASADCDRVIDALASEDRLDHDAVTTILARFNVNGGASEIQARQSRIDWLFGGDTVEIIRDRLAAAFESWAIDALDVIRHASPTSLKVTLKQMRCGDRPIEDLVRMEHRLAVRATAYPDFREGIRALLVDKDKTPHWQPDTLEAVSDALIESWFAPLDDPTQEIDLTP